MGPSSSKDEEEVEEYDEEEIFFNKLFQVSNITERDFEILKLLGEGGFAKVYQARFKITNSIFALKVLKKSQILKSKTVKRVFEERKILMEINSPFVVKLVYAFQTRTKLFFAMQYFGGGELFFHLKREYRFSPHRSRVYIAQLLFGLKALHDKGVMYRDLKPENVLLGLDGYLALADFGLSKIAEESTTICGTSEYLAPEVVNAEVYNSRADFWSIGICLYEFLTGITPFYHRNVNEIHRKILKEQPLYPPYLDNTTIDLLKGLLTKDPDCRLGATQGIDEILNHPYFDSIDLVKLQRKEVKMAFVPFTYDKADTRNFDRNFTSKKPTSFGSSDAESVLGRSASDEFSGFSFDGDHNLDSISRL
eukprot:TRINITY_DN2725_c0_g2_i1.p1 TRINITY_DN2725_c0_g2~~TRINITY_DN2725_c0_g2_i1.p1  ORF type:complete len:365 (+),score=96.56 TRINITY_DN2725_c0_g2_i1:2456-3550(+)